MFAVVKCAVTSASKRHAKINFKKLSSTSTLALDTSDASSTKLNVKGSSKRGPIIDRSKVPTLDEKDLTENFISGSGPGGQKVNKAVNCAQLRHNPTGIVVKVHQSRSLDKNREIARELLITKLDNLYNGENSVESQKKRIALKNIAVREAEQERKRALKAEFRKIVKVANKPKSDVT